MAPKPPIRFAPYGEYAEAFLFTADVSVDGLSGIAGGPEVVEAEEVGNGFEVGGRTPLSTVVICQ